MENRPNNAIEERPVLATLASSLTADSQLTRESNQQPPLERMNDDTTKKKLGESGVQRSDRSLQTSHPEDHG